MKIVYNNARIDYFDKNITNLKKKGYALICQCSFYYHSNNMKLIEFLLKLLHDKKNKSIMSILESLRIVCSIPYSNWLNEFEVFKEDKIDWNFIKELINAIKTNDFSQINHMKYGENV